MFKIPPLLVLVKVFQSFCFTKIEPMEDNFIMSTEAKVRDVFNSILDSLHLQRELDQHLQRFLSIHNHLLAVTLQSYDVIIDITKLTRLEEGNLTKVFSDEISSDDEDLYEKTIIETIKAFLVDLDHHKRVNGEELAVDTFVQNELLLNDSDLLQEYDELDKSKEVAQGSDFWVANNGTSGRRIYRGENARIKLFPFMAVVLVFKQFYCAGTIIASDLVITAASCLQVAWNNPVFRDKPTFLTIRVGSSYSAAGGEVFCVRQIHFHPTFNPQTLNDNICLLRLAKNLDLQGSQKIRKVEFDREKSTLLADAAVTIVGWGAKNDASAFPTLIEPLAFDRLNVYSLGDCQDIFSKDFVTDHNFCAGFITKGSGACNHDVGAPGIVNGVLTGIVSFGSPVCGTPDAPTVFTKIGFYAEWIQSLIDAETPTPVTTVSMETFTTMKPSSNEYTKKRSEHESAEPDEVENKDDDKVYLSFVRTLQAKDLMEVFNAKSKNSSEESDEPNSNEAKQDTERKKKRVLLLLKDLALSAMKGKQKHHKKNKNEARSTSERTTATQTDATISHDVGSSSSNEFMDLLKEKMLSAAGIKADKHKNNKSKNKTLKSVGLVSTKSLRNIKNKHKRDKKNTPEITTATTKDTLSPIKTTTSIKPIIDQHNHKIKDYYEYSDIGDSDSGSKNELGEKDVSNMMSGTTTVKEKHKNRKEIWHSIVPLSLDYLEQYYKRHIINKTLQRDKTQKQKNINSDVKSETEENSSNYYDDEESQTTTGSSSAHFTFANNVSNMLNYIPKNLKNMSQLSSFLKSIYVSGNLKDSLFRADVPTSNDTELSIALTLQEKDENSRRNKDFNNEPSKLNKNAIVKSFRHWLSKTLKYKGTANILFKKSDDEIYDLLKLVLPGI